MRSRLATLPEYLHAWYLPGKSVAGALVRHTFTCCWLLGLLTRVLSAQDLSALTFEHLTIDQGLSHSTVHSLIEDRQGFIWIGTRYGLNRFDGYDFKVFLPEKEDTSSMAAHGVFCLLEDQRGDIWIGHQESGISLFSPRHDRFSRFPEDVFPHIDWKTLSVRSFFQDSRGNIWIGTYGAGALVVDSARRPLLQLCSYGDQENLRLKNDFVFDFAEDSLGKVWIGTAGAGLAVYDPLQNRVRHLSGRPGDQMEGFGRELCLDSKGNLWVGTAGNGLYQIALPEERVTRRVMAGQGLSHNMITDLELDRAGNLWVATDGGGLNRYHVETGQWQAFHYAPKHPGSLNTEALYELTFDRHGNLWVGTFNGGVNLHRAKLTPFATNREYVPERLLGLQSVLALAQDETGAVWMGTDGAGLFSWQYGDPSVQVRPYRPREGAAFPKVITSIALTAQGTLWLGSYAEGLFYLDPKRGTTRHFTHQPGLAGSLVHNNVWDLATDSTGGLWVGTLGGGLAYLPAGSTRFVPFADLIPPDSPPLSGVQILEILLDKAGKNLWVATENAGLNRIDLASFRVVQYHHHPDSNSLSSDRLRCLYEDENGNIWVGTEYAGLNCLDPKTGRVHRYEQQDGPPSNMINDVLRGPEGHLWMSTQAGITRWDEASHTFIHLGSDPYLKNNQFNPGASLKLADGRLVFGSTNGYTIVVPDRVIEDSSLPQAMFADLYLSNELVQVGKGGEASILPHPLNAPETVVQLSYKDRGIQFLLTTDHVAQAAQQVYAFRIINYETDWQLLKPGERTVNLSGLPGGTYFLEVRAVSPSGMWGHTRTLALKVKPPFWETIWFLILCIFMGLLFLGGIVAYLLQRQRAYYQTKSIQAEKEILSLRNENLQRNIAHERSKLSASLLQMAHKNELLNDLKSRIEALRGAGGIPDAKLKKVTQEIERELKQEDYWQQFQLVFNRTHTQFMEKLHQMCPSLTDHEKRLCCFIRMQLSNREIASILNITVNGVEQAKYRIKKKLELDKEELLSDRIRDI